MNKGVLSFTYLIFLVFVTLGLCNCTTLKSHSERVKLASDPEGADVYLEGKLIGKTPGWVEIPRQKSATIRIEKKGYPTIEKKLESSYRWGDSFFSDFIWMFWGAPVAWTIDYLSGTAWDYDKVGLIVFEGKKDIAPLRAPTLIAIAPPQYPYELLSNEAAERLQGISYKRYNGSLFREFDETHNLFTQYGYTNEDKTPENYRDDLYQELNTTHILESEIKKEGDQVVIKSKLVDVFTDKEVQTNIDKLPASVLKYSEETVFSKSLNWIVGVLPNTITFDLSQPQANLYTTKNETLVGIGQTSRNMISILSSIGFKSLYTPKLSKGIKPVFKLIPIITTGFDRFNFTPSAGPNFTNGYNFDWINITAGFGPEVGFDTSIGYFYAEIAPIMSSDWVLASKDGGGDTSARGSSLAIFGEFGYSIFASNRINLRLFTRFESGPTDIWSQILTQLSGQVTPVDRMERGSAGLSIGYYFPEDRTFLKRAIFPY